MKKHSVKASISVLELSKRGSAIELEIFSEQEKLGTLRIGHGSMEWIGKFGRKGKGKSKRISWSRFAERIEDL